MDGITHNPGVLVSRGNFSMQDRDCWTIRDQILTRDPQVTLTWAPEQVWFVAPLLLISCGRSSECYNVLA
jgi:hypothetical protein